MVGPSKERCQRHPDRQADFAVVTHLLLGQWRNMIKADQVLGPVCSECRRELIAWIFPERMGGDPVEETPEASDAFIDRLVSDRTLDEESAGMLRATINEYLARFGRPKEPE